MSALRIAPLALLALGLAAPALAKDDDKEKWETRNVADKPVVTLDPAKAYILVQSEVAVTPYFMRQPSAEEAAKHAADRAEELTKEHDKWVKKHASWVKTMAGLKGQPANISRPKEPMEPTEANFSWPRYETIHPVMMGPQNRFAKQDGSVYLQEVPPGDYVYYGNYNGLAGGVCACLGTASFSAPAGKIVALRMRLPFFEAWQAAEKDQRPKDVFDLPESYSTLRLEPGSYADARLPQGMTIPAEFRPAGQLPNWFGLEVDRLMPIEGVFAYERDKQIDLRAKPPEPLAAPPAAPVAAGQ